MHGCDDVNPAKTLSALLKPVVLACSRETGRGLFQTLIQHAVVVAVVATCFIFLIKATKYKRVWGGSIFFILKIWGFLCESIIFPVTDNV